jgi:hypothetical protein
MIYLAAGAVVVVVDDVAVVLVVDGVVVVVVDVVELPHEAKRTLERTKADTERARFIELRKLSKKNEI